MKRVSWRFALKHPSLKRSFSSEVIDLCPKENHIQILKSKITTSKAWTNQSLSVRDILLPINNDIQKEITSVIQFLRNNPLPYIYLTPEMFPNRLVACQSLAQKIRDAMDSGLGLCVLDRINLDSEKFTDEECRIIFWLLGRLITRPVAQGWKGTLVYDVRDTGKDHNTQGVRRSVTKADLCFHTDNSMGRVPPEYVSLFCIRAALSGGVNRFISLYSVHNAMLQKYPDLLMRLYSPYYFDRQGEHIAGAPRVSKAPIFSYNGKQLKARLYPYIVHNGYKLLAQEMDKLGADALKALEEILADESLWIEFSLERGQVKYLNNSEFAHLRTEFTDGDSPETTRHLLRMWHRSDGKPFYDG